MSVLRGENTKNSDRDVCNTVRARELWVRMCAPGTQGRGECEM